MKREKISLFSSINESLSLGTIFRGEIRRTVVPITEPRYSIEHVNRTKIEVCSISLHRKVDSKRADWDRFMCHDSLKIYEIMQRIKLTVIFDQLKCDILETIDRELLDSYLNQIKGMC